MARPLEFDRKQALERAMEVFWTKGYRATSVNDLMQAMGLSKSSLYGTFDSKHAIFIDCIDFYRDNVTIRVRFAMGLTRPAIQIIGSILGRAVDRILEPDGRRGCFLNNSAVEVGAVDLEAAAHCRSGFKIMEETFETLVRRGQAEGDISKECDPKKLALFLNCTVNGIMVAGKANPDRRNLEDIAETAMRALA